ncbi:hypothetical protein ACFYPC_27345 [Streptomyces sp. NPDC005808]|uniref:nSTAND1 domain-containing NTPase n=1 Tax=Streptomyces sp. NPDC005808 TaxID=3364734 RepID=UPI0036B7DE4B
MARQAAYSVTALSQAAAGQRLPSLPLTLAYAQVCGGDVTEWERRWHEVAGKEAAQRLAQDDADPPYRGLARFELGDAALFFGRDHLVDRLVDLATAHRFTAVFGPSGSGKSSLLRAGLIPRLRNADRSSLSPAAVRILAPGEQPMRAHGERLVPAPHEDGDTWLIVDQFEELYTLCIDPAERTAFIDRLLAARKPGSGLRVIVAVRADFLSHCAEHAGLTAALQDATLLTGPMSSEELRAAIVKPAAAAGLIVERALTARILTEVDGEPGALPLMSHALLETWRHRRGRTLTEASYEEAGGLHGSISRTAEDVYRRLTDAQAVLARRVLLRLISPGDGAPDTRRPADRAELDLADDPQDTTAVLESLVRARLLTLSEGTVDLAHEALITAWPRLRGWIVRDREALRVHRRLTEATAVWESLDRDPGALYRGTRLDLARDLTGLTPRERAFLDASAAAEAAEATRGRRRVHRLRQLVALLAVLFISASGATVYAIHIEGKVAQQRNTALAQRAAGEAVGLRLLRPSLAAQLSLAAYRLAPEDSTRDALLSTMATTISGHTQVVSSAAVSPDGRTLATSSFDRTIRLWNVTDPRRPVGLATFTGHADTIAMVAFSPDGHTLASGGRDHTIRLWNITDLHDPSPYGPPLTGHTDTVFSVAFSPDGKTLASGSYDHTIRLWDVTDATRPARLPELTGHTLNVKPVAFSPDGRTLASGSDDRTVRLWDVTDPRHPAQFAVLTGHKDFVDALAFSPDGRTLASGSDDRTVRLWNVTDLRDPSPSDVLRGHDDVVSGIAFSPDGRALATSSYDRSVRVWNLARADRPASLAVLTGHLGAVQSVAFTPDGGKIITTGADHTAQIWDTDTRTTVDRACAQAHPTITRTEWSRYFPGLEYQPPCG